MVGRTNTSGKPEEEKTVTAGTSAVVVNPSSGKTMKKVTVNPTPSQTKTVTAGTSNVNVSPDSGKLLSKVTVAPTPTQSKSVTPSTSQQTVTPDAGKHLSSVVVNAAGDDVKFGKFVWAKYTAKGGTFVDYATSDSANAYPNGAVSGGYYYEQLWEVVIPASGYSNNQLRINVAGMKSTYNPICSISTRDSSSNTEALSEAFGCIEQIDTYNNYIIVTVSSVPSVAVTVSLKGSV